MYTILEQKENKTVIEKSKFISYIYSCSSHEEQTSLLKKLKREHLSATHICFASSFFSNNQILNYSSDDGEPSGTAGLQILQALKENSLVNVLCVVVRYFGGIKLGVAGLGRAYKDSALQVIIDNKKKVCLRTKYNVVCDYNQYSFIKSYLDKNFLKQEDLNFDNNVSFFVYLNDDELKSVQNWAQNIRACDFEQKYC